MRNRFLLIPLVLLIILTPSVAWQRGSSPLRVDPAVTEPPVGRVDESAPFYRLEKSHMQLRRIINQYESVGRGRASKVFARLLMQTADNVSEAMASYSGEVNSLRPTHLRETLRSIARAEVRLAVLMRSRRLDNDMRSSLDQIAHDLAVVARDITQNIYATAERARVHPRRLVPARRRIMHGDMLLAKKLYPHAVVNYGSGLGIAANTVVFDPELFEQNIRNAFDNQTVGYSYAINVNGQLFSEGASGFARTSADSPEIPYSPTTQQHIASVSKTLVAIAVLDLLEKNDISTDDFIDSWFPAGWARGTGVGDITFENLMRHRSRFGQRIRLGAPKIENPSTYEGLKQLVESTNGWLTSSFSYQNANYGMMRVLVPMILGFDPSTKPEDQQADFAAFIFTGYLQSFYNQIGVNIDCLEEQIPPTLYYSFPDNGANGWELFSDFLDGCGGYGIFSTAHDLAKILAYMRFTDELISPEMRKQMNSKFLGWMNPNDGYSWANGDFGAYRAHGGDWADDGDPKRGLDTCVIDFPIPVQAVVLTNSVGGNYGGMNLYQCSALVTAFDNAWVAD